MRKTTKPFHATFGVRQEVIPKGMEDAKDVDMSPGQDQARGETIRSPKLTNHENGVIMLDNAQNVDKIETEAERDRTEANSKAIEETKAVVSCRKADRSKKPKESAPKELARSKVTVPHPFSLATGKRMSQERRRSVDLSPLKEKQAPTPRVRCGSVDLAPKQMPKLSKSVSCVNKVQSPSDAGKARSKMENGNSLAANSKVPKRSLTAKALGSQNTNGQRNQNKQLQISVKQGGDATGTSKVGNGKSLTFRALPLPSFYRRTDLTSKLDVANKTFHRAGSPQRNKPKKRDISNGAKQTITKLIKSTRRALNPSKETVKSVVAAC